MTATTQRKPSLVFNVEGGSLQQLSRGMSAALAVFELAGCTPDAAASARFAIESWDENGFDAALLPTDEQWRVVGIWDEANDAAVKACCDGWAAIPEDAGISLAFDDESPVMPPSPHGHSTELHDH